MEEELPVRDTHESLRVRGGQGTEGVSGSRGEEKEGEGLEGDGEKGECRVGGRERGRGESEGRKLGI